MCSHITVWSPCLADPGFTDRKGKVESGIGYTKRTALKGMRFEALEEAQAYLDRWEERWANTRIHGTTKRQVAAMFLEEKSHLLPLPLEPFRYYQYGDRVVHLDGCVEVEAAYYGLPPGWIGRSVKVQWDALHVRILHPNTDQLLREHLRETAADIASRKKTTQRKCRSAPRSSCGGLHMQAPKRASSANCCTTGKEKQASAASWACFLS